MRASNLVSADEAKVTEKIAMLNEWIVFAELQSKLHSKSATHFKKLNKFFMVPIIFVSAVTGCANLIGLPVIDCNENDKSPFRPSQFILGLLNISTAALTAIYNFAKLGEAQESHSIHSTEYEKLSRQIRVELLLHGTADRTFISLAEYIKDCKERIDKLVERSPEIPSKVIKSYLKSQMPSQKPKIFRRSKEYEHPPRRSFEDNNHSVHQRKHSFHAMVSDFLAMNNLGRYKRPERLTDNGQPPQYKTAKTMRTHTGALPMSPSMGAHPRTGNTTTGLDHVGIEIDSDMGTLTDSPLNLFTVPKMRSSPPQPISAPTPPAPAPPS